MTLTQNSYPTTDVDIFEQSISFDPFETYRELRDLGPAVWNTTHEYWAVTRYEDVKAVLQNNKDFISGAGVAHDDMFNAPVNGKVVLASDPPTHTRLRAQLMDKLSPKAMRKLRSDVQTKVDTIIDETIVDGTFDAVPRIAQAVPMKVVGDLMGLPEDGRHLLLKGAEAMFSSFAPMSPVILERLPHAQAYLEWIDQVAKDRNFTPDSWGAALNQGVEKGDLSFDEMTATISALLVAGFDTTVNSIGASLRYFAERPDIWRALQEDESRIPAVFEETVRMESPVVAFFRRAAHDTDIKGTPIAAGDRILVAYGSANRDERHYPDPDRFDIDRNPVDHVGMGSGIHACAGSALARVEAFSVTKSLLERVETIELASKPVRRYNPCIRGLQSLPLTVTLKEK